MAIAVPTAYTVIFVHYDFATSVIASSSTSLLLQPPMASAPLCRSASRNRSFRVISDNLFVVQANCLGNSKKMTEGGPWNFRGLGILMDKYDGVSPPEEIVLDSLEVWIQIHRIPDIYRKVELVEKGQDEP
jgi:hypothetical protein